MLLGAVRAALLAVAAAALAEPPGPAAANPHEALRLPEGERSELQVGTSTLIELIEGPRAGSRHRCTIMGRGELPDTYDVKVFLDPVQNLTNVAVELLQKPSEASSFVLRPRPIPVLGAQDKGQGHEPEEGVEGRELEEARRSEGEELAARSHLKLNRARSKLREDPAEEEEDEEEEDSESSLDVEEDPSGGKEDSRSSLDGDEEPRGGEEDSKSSLDGKEEPRDGKEDSKSSLDGEEEPRGGKEDSKSSLDGKEEPRSSKEDSKNSLDGEEESKGSKEDSRSSLDGKEEPRGSKEDSKSRLDGERESKGNKEDSKSSLDGEGEPKDSKEDSKSKKEEEELAAIRKILGRNSTPVKKWEKARTTRSSSGRPSWASSPTTKSRPIAAPTGPTTLEAAEAPKLFESLRNRFTTERHRRAAAASARRESSKRKAEVFSNRRDKFWRQEAARQAALRAQRKAYWQASKEKLHLTVRDWNGTQLDFQVRAILGVRVLMLTAINRLGLAKTQVRFLRNGTQLRPVTSLMGAGLRDHDVIDVEPVDPRVREAPSPAAAKASARAREKKPEAAAPPPAPTWKEGLKAWQGARRPNNQTWELRRKGVEKKKPPRHAPLKLKGSRAKSPDVEYEVGDFMEMKLEQTLKRPLVYDLEEGSLQFENNWIPCTIKAKGSKPNTYKVHFPLAPNQQGDIDDVPSFALRMVQAQDWAKKIKGLRNDPAAVQEALEKTAREAKRRDRLKNLTSRVKGLATTQTANQTAQKPTPFKLPAPLTVRRPLAPMTQHGSLRPLAPLPQHGGLLPSPALDDKRTARR